MVNLRGRQAGAQEGPLQSDSLSSKQQHSSGPRWPASKEASTKPTEREKAASVSWLPPDQQHITSSLHLLWKPASSSLSCKTANQPLSEMHNMFQDVRFLKFTGTVITAGNGLTALFDRDSGGKGHGMT